MLTHISPAFFCGGGTKAYSADTDQTIFAVYLRYDLLKFEQK